MFLVITLNISVLVIGLVIYWSTHISIFFNEPHKIVRVSIDIAEKIQDYSPGDHRQEKEKKLKKNTPGWIGTSTRGTRNSTLLRNTTRQLSPDWIGASTRINTQNCRATAADQAKLPRQSMSSYLGSCRRNTILRQ